MWGKIAPTRTSPDQMTTVGHVREEKTPRTPEEVDTRFYESTFCAQNLIDWGGLYCVCLSFYQILPSGLLKKLHFFGGELNNIKSELASQCLQWRGK